MAKKTQAEPEKKPFRSKRADGRGHRKKIEANFKNIEKEVNINQVVYWIGLQATMDEIAGSFNISPDTLDRRLREEFGMSFAVLKKRMGDGGQGKLSLRKYQFDQARNNSTMAIWLGKQWLGQKDTIVNENITRDESVKIYIPSNGRD
jgi:AraC-like DNA-binding protein